MCPKIQCTSNKPTLYKMWHVIYFGHLCYALRVCIQMYIYIDNYLVHYVPTPTASIYWHIVRLVHIMCTFSISCSTVWNSVLPHRTQKHYSFSAGIPATQVGLFVHYLLSTSYAPHLSSSSAPRAEGSL